eukprot:NODE_4633_length_765_cov_1.670846_g4610_i0.p2 GENE.NODE_4633_length_765_cov_1.670846_g4610_i0~~NODE_4633_length_765_cov_1.670846_g4610_i0.p2  ORF type:complete len:181 (-),score=18.25 NODE_4633_length_765_cov_1.670846_g4610_i0:191-733(-)
MGPLIDGHQAFGIDRGIALGRRKRGVAEQILNGTQITATGQKVGGKGMAHGMRGGGIGQVQKAAYFAHFALGDLCDQPPAACANKKRLIAVRGIGAGADIIINRVADDLQNRDKALFVALAGDDHRSARRALIGIKVECLGYTQAAAIKQGEQGEVAFGKPRFILPRAGIIKDGHRIGGA